MHASIFFRATHHGRPVECIWHIHLLVNKAVFYVNRTSFRFRYLMIFNVIWQDLVKYSIQLGENVSDLQKALELMLSVPHRAINNKFVESIEGYRGKARRWDVQWRFWP